MKFFYSKNLSNIDVLRIRAQDQSSTTYISNLFSKNIIGFISVISFHVYLYKMYKEKYNSIHNANFLSNVIDIFAYILILIKSNVIDPILGKQNIFNSLLNPSSIDILYRDLLLLVAMVLISRFFLSSEIFLGFKISLFVWILLIYISDESQLDFVAKVQSLAEDPVFLISCIMLTSLLGSGFITNGIFFLQIILIIIYKDHDLFKKLNIAKVILNICIAKLGYMLFSQLLSVLSLVLILGFLFLFLFNKDFLKNISNNVYASKILNKIALKSN